MSKERLEVYKKMPPFAVDEKGFSLITEEQYCWLFDYAVEKSERVEELEKQRKEDLHDFVNDIIEQNNRYRELIDGLYDSGYANKFIKAEIMKAWEESE